MPGGNMQPQQTFAVPPFDWKAAIRDWVGQGRLMITNMMRGEPAPGNRAEQRPVPAMIEGQPFGNFHYRVTRRHDRGAYAFAYEGGYLDYDPLGAGFVVPWKMPVEPGRTGVIEAGVIYWNTTPQNQALVPPAGGRPLPPRDLIALLGFNAYDAVTANPYDVAPPPVGYFP